MYLVERKIKVLKEFSETILLMQESYKEIIEKAYKAIHQRQVELALTTLDDANDLNHADLKILPLWQDEMVCVCANNHPLAQQSSLTLADLSKVPAILPEPDTITFQLVERIFQQQGLTLHPSTLQRWSKHKAIRTA